MAHSLRILLLLSASLLIAAPIRTSAQSNLTCYSSYQFVPTKYSTCNTLRDNSTVAWSLSYNNTLNPYAKYLKGLYVSVPRQPGGWVAWGLNIMDQKLMQNSSVLACYNTAAGPKVVQLWLDDTDYDGVHLDHTKDRLNVTSKNCFVQSVLIDGVPAERIYIQFEITLGAKAQYIHVYGKGPTSSTGSGGAAGTAIMEHADHDARHDRVLRDFREISDPGLAEPPLPSPPPPPLSSPPPLEPATPPPSSPPLLKTPPPLKSPPSRRPPPPRKSPPSKKSPPPPSKKSPPPIKKSPPPTKKSPPPPKKSPPPTKKSPPPPKSRPPPSKGPPSKSPPIGHHR